MNPERQNQELIKNIAPIEHVDDYLLLHLREKILPELIQPLPGREITLLDYGCGDGRTTSWIAAELGEKFPHKTIQAWGYDPFLSISEKSREWYANYAKRHKIPELQWSNSVETLPNKVDCALFHFSMHHIAKTLEKLRDEIVALTNSLNMSSVIVSEYDFKSPNVDLETFLYVYLGSDAGKKEFPQYKTNEECFADHMRFGEQDYINILQEAEFTIAKRVKSNIDIERYNFTLVGTRAS